MKEILEEMKKDISNPYFMVLLGILGVGAFLRLKYAFFEGMWVDEARMARTALEVGKHPWDYGVSELWRGQITKMPPLYPYLLILSQYIFGRNEFAIRLVSPLVSMVGVGLTYIMGKEMKNKQVGLLAAALLTFNGIYWFLSERLLIGATFAVVYTATILALYYGLEDKEHSKYVLWALGPLTTLALLTKQSSYTLGIIIPVYFGYKRWDDLKDFKENMSLDKARDNFSDIGIAIGLGAITLLPWSLRSQAVCGYPLCGLRKAFSFATKGGSVNEAVFSVQGPMYFIKTMPNIITLPVAFLLGAMVVKYFLDKWDENPDLLVKYAVFVIIGTGVGYLFKAALIPFILITSMAIIAENDAEKLLWIWAGVGIGVMSVPSIKVPRYIVFTIPSLVTLASISAWKTSAWLSRISENDVNNSSIILGVLALAAGSLSFVFNLIPVTMLGAIFIISGIAVLITKKTKDQYLKATTILLIIALPMIFVSYASGIQNAQAGGYPAVKDAGEWLDDNSGEDARILATSFRQVMYQAYPRIAWMPPENKSEMKTEINEKNISFVVIDTYEKAQPEWAQTDVAPYRIPNKVRNQLRQRQIQPGEVRDMFKETPDYMVPLETFGKTRMPLTREAQPAAIVYKVNQTALEEQ